MIARTVFIAAVFLFALSGFVSAGEPAPAAEKDPFATAVKEGRELFKKKLYVESLDRFALALTLKPEDREAALLAGLAALWARNPGRALEFWNELLDTAKRNSVDEFEIETHRVMALYALRQPDAAEQVVERLYELRRKVAALKTVDGFVREHIYLRDPAASAEGAEKILRVGVKETFDERNEAQRIWIFAVVAQSDKDDTVQRRLSVEAATLPGGEAGYILAEDSGSGRRVFKRWLQKPAYAEVRTLVLSAIHGKVTPLEGKPATPAAVADPVKKPPPAVATQTPSIAQERIFTEQELILAARAKALSGDGAVQQILAVAARLRELDFDVTKLTRLSLSDADMAARYLDELKARAPYAQEDAAELVDLISKARVEALGEALLKLAKFGPRQPYLEYALLTGLNTRGRDLPVGFLKECLKSSDFMVRHTAALMLARGGDKKALAQLFKELEVADAAASGILHVALSELLGNVIAEPPPAGAANEAALKNWKRDTARWWQQNEKKLNVVQERAAADPYWK